MLFNIISFFIVFAIATLSFVWWQAAIFSVLICVISFILFFIFSILGRILFMTISAGFKIVFRKKPQSPDVSIPKADKDLVFVGIFTSLGVIGIGILFNVSIFIAGLTFVALFLMVWGAFIDRVLSNMPHSILLTTCQASIFLSVALLMFRG